MTRARRIDRKPKPIAGWETAVNGMPVATSKPALNLVALDLVYADVHTYWRCAYTDDNGRRRKGVLKIAAQQRDDDLTIGEGLRLTQLVSTAPELAHLQHYLPADPVKLVATWNSGQRQANIFPYNPKVYTLREVIAQYPAGVPLQDAAWIINRMLEGLYYLHKTGWIHGSVLPCSVLVHTERHSAKLGDWSYAVKGEHLQITRPLWPDYYPPEVKAKKKATPALDIYMAAMTALKFLGGDTVLHSFPNTVPEPARNFLKLCLMANPARRPADAGALREEFDSILLKLYGQRHYRPLVMPVRV